MKQSFGSIVSKKYLLELSNSRMDTHKKELEEIWEQVPPDYYQYGVKNNIFQRFWHTKKLAAVLNLLSETYRPETILDVGCASGWFLFQVTKKFPKAESYGIDVYKSAISFGKQKYKRIHFTQADAHEIPFRANSFDLVLCTEVLEHVEKPEAVLAEIHRVLSKNGVAIIEMDTGNILFKLVWFWWTTLRRGVWKDAHIHSFTAKKLEKQILKNDFTIIAKKKFNLSMAIVFLVKKK